MAGLTADAEGADTDWLALTGTAAAAYAQWMAGNEPDLNSGGLQGTSSAC